MKSLLYQIYFGNTVKEWLIALAIACGLVLVLRVFNTRVLTKIRKWTFRSNNTLDDFFLAAIDRSVLPVLYVLAVYAGLYYLNLSARADRVINVFTLVVITFFILRLVTFIVEHFVFGLVAKQKDSDLKRKQARGLIIILNVTLWVLGFVFLVDNLGYDVTTVTAGLGIGGIAIALAAQAILGDLFSYFVIFFDKPFEIGDFISVDDKMGTIEYIGLKTTRVRALSGEQIIFSNTNLTNARVHNYKRMEKRRAVFNIAVHVETAHDALQRIPDLVKQIVVAQPNLVYDRGHFLSFGQSSFNFEFIYFVDSPDMNLFMDRQQSINLEVLKAFETENIKIAFPTQTLLVNKETVLSK